MNMTKEDAVKAMQEGKKVRHFLFSPDEWMTMRYGLIHLEDGVVCTTSEFWFWRCKSEWNEGYEIIND